MLLGREISLLLPIALDCGTLEQSDFKRGVPVPFTDKQDVS